MKVADVVQKYWDENGARIYDKINYIDENKLRGTLLNHLEMDKHRIILDFGVGSGSLASVLAKSGYRRIIGVDINKSMLTIAREKLSEYPVKLVCGDGLHLPIADNSVDAVVSKWVLWVMPDPERAIEEMIRVTKPGGKILTFSSGSINGKKKTIWNKLACFPIRQIHSAYLELSLGQRGLTTKQFWKETEGKLPMYSLDKYTQIFKQKGLNHVERTEKEEYGTLRAKLFFGGFKFSLIKGVKPGRLDEHISGFKSEDWGINDFLKILACPICHSSIRTISDNELVCNECNRTFSIIQGIPNLLPEENVIL